MVIQVGRKIELLETHVKLQAAKPEVRKKKMNLRLKPPLIWIQLPGNHKTPAGPAFGIIVIRFIPADELEVRTQAEYHFLPGNLRMITPQKRQLRKRKDGPAPGPF